MPTRPPFWKGLEKTLARSGLALFMCLHQPALARELAGIHLPTSLPVASESLVLNGAGVRSKLLFKVYVAALYLKTPARKLELVEQTPGPKLIVMHFLRDVGASSIRQAWSEGIERNCPSDCNSFQPLIQKLNAMMIDLRTSDVLSLTLLNNEVTVKHGQREIGVISGPGFGNMMLRVFIGPNPPTEDLRNGLLGG